MAGDLSGLADKQFDLLIVGAGLSGAVLAERCSKELGMTSLMIDCRSHIGGNCYDYIDEHGIRASKYGAHLFHTKFERVWGYVQQFSQWIPFDHRVKGRVPDKDGVKQLVPIPPTQETNPIPSPNPNPNPNPDPPTLPPNPNSTPTRQDARDGG